MVAAPLLWMRGLGSEELSDCSRAPPGSGSVWIRTQRELRGLRPAPLQPPVGEDSCASRDFVRRDEERWAARRSLSMARKVARVGPALLSRVHLSLRVTAEAEGHLPAEPLVI